MGYLPPPDQEREIAEQFRHIKRPLLARALGRGTPQLGVARSIMVTSALPGEGKTFSAINLALSLALEERTPACCWWMPTSSSRSRRAFRPARAKPASSMRCSDESLDVESLVVQTSVPKLAVLPAGRTPHGLRAELLSSAAHGRGDRAAEVDSHAIGSSCWILRRS